MSRWGYDKEFGVIRCLIETAKANCLYPMKYIQFIMVDIHGTAFLEYPEFMEYYMPWNPVSLPIRVSLQTLIGGWLGNWTIVKKYPPDSCKPDENCR